jgi:hypothetical protein
MIIVQVQKSHSLSALEIDGRITSRWISQRDC